MEWKEFETTFSVKLNQQQKEAVQSTKGPVLLLAVPGSGKTTVLVTRLGYMIYCKNIPPERILTVTYTVAATKDMSERFAVRFGEDMAKRLEFRTINGICARIIQYYGRRIGKTPFELVKDEKATTGMLIRICQDHGMGYPTESDLKNVRTLITYIKNMMLTEEELQKLEEESDIRIAGIHLPCYEVGTVTQNTNAYVKAIENPMIDIISHPDDSRIPIDYETIVDAAKENHTLLEINNSSLDSLSSRVGAWQNLQIMIQMCKEKKVPVVAGTDAHFSSAVGVFDHVEVLLQEMNFPEELVVNRSVDVLKQEILQHREIRKIGRD